MKNSKKGFAISGILYPLLILTLFLVVQMLFMLQTRKNVLDKSRTELADSVNDSNTIYTNEELSNLIDDYKVELDKLKYAQSKTLSNVYPVGSIYMSYSSANPSSIFGGTWASYGAGRTLVGMDTSQTEFNTIGKTGGAKIHILTTSEMPSHNHTIYNDYTNTSIPFAMGIVVPGDTDIVPGIAPKNGGFEYGRRNYTFSINNAGGNQAHNNLQPYITVYMWRRTA